MPAFLGVNPTELGGVYFRVDLCILLKLVQCIGLGCWSLIPVDLSQFAPFLGSVVLYGLFHPRDIHKSLDPIADLKGSFLPSPAMAIVDPIRCFIAWG